MYDILEPNKPPFKYIIHLADIHIRTGDRIASRYDQYMTVFYNLISSINQFVRSKNSNDNTLIIIAGDIIHNKNRLENFGAKLLQYLIYNLTSIAPTIIIPGNHDFEQSYPDDPSMLEACLPPEYPNLIFLDKTCCFLYRNLGITTISIKDTLVKGEGSGIKPDNYSFPLNFNKTPDKIIGIFHGTLRDSQLNYRSYVDTNMQAYPTSILEGIDIGILGDIHIPQVFQYNDTCKYSYCGSLIQQDRGEEPFNHGYNLWNIPKNTLQFKQVNNPEAYLNLNYINHTWFITNLKQNKSLYDCITSSTYFPSNIYIQINKNNCNTENIEQLKDILSSHNITCSNFTVKTLNNTTQHDDISSINNFDIMDDIINNIQYQPLISIIKNPHILTIKDNISCSNTLINDCNKKIQDYIIEFEKTKTQDISNNRHFEISYLEFGNLLCYGKYNYINLETFDNNIVLINGKNATGKSALYEIICYSLFSEPMPSRKDKHYSASFINTNKKQNEKSYSTIHISINNIKYSIYKTYRYKDKNLIISNPTIENLNTREIICEGKNNTKKWIQEHIGTLDDFLKTSMITQNLDNNILDVKPSQIKEDIDNIINVSQIQSLKELLKISKSMYSKLNTVLEDKLSSFITSTPSLTQYNTETLNTYKEQTYNLNTQCNQLEEQINQIHIDYNMYPKTLLDNTLTTNHITLPSLTEDECIKLKHKYEEKLKNINIEKLSKKYNNTIQHEFDTLKPPPISNVDITYLDNIYNELYQYIQNPPPKPTYDTPYIEQMIQSITTERDKLMLQKPKIEINTTNTIKKILKKINKLCSNIDICKSIYNQYSYNTNINNTDITIENIIDINDIDHTIETSKQQITTNKNILSNLQLTLTELQSKLYNLNKEFRNLEHISKPKIPKTTCNEFISKFKHTETSYLDIKDTFDIFNTNLDKIKILEQQYQQNINLLEQYNNLEYNPKCHICIKQPMVQQMLQIQTQQKQLQEDIDQHNTTLNNHKYTPKKYNKYNQIITEYNQLKPDIDKYTNCLAEYTIYEPYYNTCLNLKHNITQIETQITSINKDITKTQDNITYHENTINNIYIYINKIHDLYNEYIYITWETDLDTQTNKLNTWKKELEQSQLYYTITPKIKNYQHLKNTYDTYQQYINKQNHLQLIIDANYYTNTIIPYCNTWTEYNYTQNAIKLQPLHTQKKQLILEHQTIKNTYISMKEKTDKYEKDLEYYNQNINIKNNLDTSLHLIQTTINELTQCDKTINTYHDNLYSQKILPTIVSKANKICSLSYHTHSNKIFLGANIDNNGINWMIHTNNTNEVISINKASGYQRFIAGLALRLSIPELRQSSHSCKQLFLDEGFTSADKLNLSIIPTLLKTLLSKYTSVILVSHIDNIKNSVDATIDITIDKDKNSQITSQ
jgi:DNA repair exonuclease SbcCD ATPase subunit/predicted phosphodiesterase